MYIRRRYIYYKKKNGVKENVAKENGDTEDSLDSTKV